MRFHPSPHPSSAARARSRGFTMPEMMVASICCALIMLGVMTLYISSLRLQSRAQSEIDSSLRAAYAMRHVADVTREALYFSLPAESAASFPDNGCFNNTTANSNGCGSINDLSLVAASGVSGVTANTPPVAIAASRFGSYTNNTFVASYTNPLGNVYYCCTALYVQFPNLNTTSRVVTSSGTAVAPVGSIYDRTTTGNFLIFFRSDRTGTPQPQNGTCLWETGYDNGLAVDKAVVTNIDANTWDAVEFSRPLNFDPTVPNAQITSSTDYIENEVQIKITCGEYSAINGQQTSEATNGVNTTQLVGRCVSIRNFNTAGTYDAHLNTTNRPTGSSVLNQYQSS